MRARQRRRSAWMVLGAACLALTAAGCGAPPSQDGAQKGAADEDGWVAAPRITSVTAQRAGVLIRGEAPPGARVVLAGSGGAAMAAGADNQGRFEIPAAATVIGQVLTPEIQLGQSSIPGQARLLTAGDGTLLAALLVDGVASRRLTPGPVLDAVDGDGRGLIASGRAEPGRRVQVQASGAKVVGTADETGRWTTVLPGLADRAVSIAVDGKAFAYPGPGPAISRAERAGAGWRVTRSLSGPARQTSWFPDVDDRGQSSLTAD